MYINENYIILPTKKESSDFTELFKRYDKIHFPSQSQKMKLSIFFMVITIGHTHKQP